MRMTWGGGGGWWCLGRRLSPKTVAIVAMILISFVWNVLSDWTSIADLRDLVPWQERAEEMIRTGLWLADVGLAKLGLSRTGLGGACDLDG